MSKTVKYAVDIGGGEACGTVFVDDNATDDDIRLAIMDDLYFVCYEIEEDKNDQN